MDSRQKGENNARRKVAQKSKGQAKYCSRGAGDCSSDGRPDGIQGLGGAQNFNIQVSSQLRRKTLRKQRCCRKVVLKIWWEGGATVGERKTRTGGGPTETLGKANSGT